VDFFNESYFTGSTEKADFPSLEGMLKFLQRIFKVGQFNPETCIVTLIYVNRLLGLSGMSLTPENWKPVTVGCLIVAQKVWDDVPLTICDFSILYPQLKPAHFNLLENKILTILQYKLNVSLWLYAFYYFNLRLICDQNTLFADHALTMQQMRVLLRGEDYKRPKRQSTTLIDLVMDRSRAILS